MAAELIDDRPIGYYVHHHGKGHMQRALTICGHITRPVIMFSSLERPAQLPDHVTYIQLGSDVIDGYVSDTDNAFHYTPFAAQIFARNQQLIDAWRQYDIQEIYVDVSIEVAMLAKLYGLKVGHALMLGKRSDQAHTYGYNAVDYLLAHYSAKLSNPDDFTTAKQVLYSGGISRYVKRSPQPLRTNDGMPATIVIVVSPEHEQDMSARIVDTAEKFEDTTWHVVGQTLDTALTNVVSHGVMADPQPMYERADIIIGSGGTNIISDVASFGKPFVCIPEPRPYGEQRAAAKALARLNAAAYRSQFPCPHEWPALLQELQNLDLPVFNNLVDDTAAERAAMIIESTGRAY